jgi:predicted transcriptional regulator
VAENSELTEMTAEIVAAYVSNSSVAVAELPSLIQQVHRALSDITSGIGPLEAVATLVPAVSIKKSITPEYLTCLEDGRKFKSLKRHLHTRYNLTPDAYRTKWGLTKDYPMVAPNYAASRSALAKQMGLGQGGRRPAAEAAPQTAPAPAKRGRGRSRSDA